MKETVKNIKNVKGGKKREQSARGCACGKGGGRCESIGELSSNDLFANIRLASRMLTNLYNSNMPAVTVNVGTSLTKEIPLKVTQLVVLQALYDTSWWEACCQHRIARTVDDRREKLEKYYKKHSGMVVQIDLSQQLGLDCTTVCRNLKALVESGWVVSKRSEASQREVLVGLTPQGRQVVEKALEHAHATSSRLGDKLGVAFVTKLNSQLRTVIEKCNELIED